jgi:hypothetical protein
MRTLFPILLIAGAFAASATAATRQGGATTAPAYQMELHAMGSGGVSSSDDYVLEGTAGQWSVNVVRLEDAPSGYALEGGIWPGIAQADCTSGAVKFTADLSACH